MPGLATLEQGDFSGGMHRVPRHLIPPNGVYDAQDAILTDDGSLVERGGTVWSSDADQALRLVALGSSYLPATQAWTKYALYLSGTSLLWRARRAGAWNTIDLAAVSMTEIGQRGALTGELLFATPDLVWGGRSTASLNYTTGNIMTVNGSTTVVGTGTAWATVPDIGHGSIITRTAPAIFWGVVRSVTDNTHLELTAPWRGDSTGAPTGYQIANSLVLTSQTPVPLLGVIGPTYQTAVGSPPRLAYVRSQYLVFSEPGEPWYYLDYPVGLESFHELPAGSPIGLAAIGDTAVVFMAEGIWCVDNMNLDQTDTVGNPQHRIRRYSDLALWGNASVAEYKHAAVIAAALDDIYILDGRSEPVRISKPITGLYRSYVAAGYKPGQAAVWNNHYILPITNPGATAIDTLVCRLDTRAWTRWTTPGVAFNALYDPALSPPQQLGGGEYTRLATSHSCFIPAAAVKNDASGGAPQLSVTTRDFELGSNSHNQVKQVRVSYELADAAADNPTLRAYVATDAPGSSFTRLMTPEDTAPESDGGTPYTWTANDAGRVVRLKVEKGAQATSGLVLRRVELFYRPAGKQV